ncbi:tetraspanin [Plakobranchus ocellatus]|uniref:Tetraspanin n=1 Tax=Plakobranchus ocellatus TaxID=259542 RepID=A0AAV4DER2_9GAST|nr:tetraspanin [Plakobranchus ocellatus]
MENDLVHTISGKEVIMAYGGHGRSYKEHRGDHRACSCLFWCRYCLFFLNFIVWASGIAMIGLGAWTQVNGAGLKIFDELLDEPSYMLIGTGVAMVLVGVYGCVVSVKINAWGLRVFMILVIALFVVQVVLGGIGFFLLDDVHNEMSDIVRKAVIYYRIDGNLARDEDMDELQIEFKCCGGHSFADWEANEEYTEMFSYTEGCIVSILKTLKTHVSIVAGLAFSVSVLEIICLVLANVIIKNTVYHRRLLSSIG